MFIVIEIQKSNGQIATLDTPYDNYRDAMAKYHTILAAAAKSGLERHGAIIITENLTTVAYQSFVKEEENE